MIRAIINADDLGKSREVNMAISGAFKNKEITSSTILANSAMWDDVREIVGDNSDMSFGVHLNLTEGPALTDSSILHKYQIVDGDNCFTKRIKDLDIIPQDLLVAIFDEWDRQIYKVKVEECINVDHLDGHHHVHSILALSGLLCQLGEKYNIRRLRNRYYYPKGLLYGAVRVVSRMPIISKCFYKSQYGGKIMTVIEHESETAIWQKEVRGCFQMTDYFNSYEGEAQLLKKSIKLPDNSVIELMCHPGHPAYKEEYRMIKNHLIESLSNISLINYRAL